jgi:hypothetical protein
MHEQKEDPIKRKILDNYNKNQNLLSDCPAMKLIAKEGKYGVNEYYEKCVL